MYLTETQLRDSAHSTEGLVYKSLYLKKRSVDATITVFLSHSHQDEELILGFINLLARYGIYIYVDWQDSMMPRITCGETASRIKARIAELDYFLVLATKNAVKSRWVPWEVGFADAVKSFDKIAIVPVADPLGRFEGNEYMQLYQTIEIGEIQTKSLGERLAVFPPSRTRGRFLKSWLSSS